MYTYFSILKFPELTGLLHEVVPLCSEEEGLPGEERTQIFREQT